MSHWSIPTLRTHSPVDTPRPGRSRDATHRRSVLWRAALTLALLATLLAPAPAANAGPDTPDVPDTIVAGPEGDQKNFFPDITRLRDGRLVTVYYQATQHSRDDGRILWTESTDEGRTWSTPRKLIDTPQDDRDPQITQLADGTIVINWFRTDWTSESTTGAVILGSFVTRSVDGGMTWSDPVLVDSRMSCGCGAKYGAYRLGWSATTGKIVELTNGDLLLPLYGTLPDGGTGHASVVRSTDGGRTWPVEQEAMIPVPAGVSLSEMALAVTGDNQITALLRTAGRDTHQSDSLDGGLTWSVPTKTAMKGQAHHILELPGGMLLTTYGDSSGAFDSNEPVVGRVRLKDGTWDSHDSVLMYRAGVNVDQADPSTVALDENRFLTVSYDEARGSVIGTYSELGDFLRARKRPDQRDPSSWQPPAGSILDLSGMLADGRVSYDTDMTSRNRDHPIAQPGGALDGVATYWNCTLGLPATPQAPRQFTLNLAEPTELRGIGLTLKPGYAETASVYVSTDGVTWGDPVDVRTDEIAAEHVTTWTRLDQVRARAVKVVITESVGDSMISELYVAS